jgi:hypothetical protein
MPGLCFTAIACHSNLLQDSSIFQTIRQSPLLSLLRRAMRNALFFLMLLFIPILASAADVTLAWDSNNEADLEGYGVYFQKDTPGPPYDLFGNITLQELADPDNPTFTLTGLEKGSRYYFTLSSRQ